MDFSILAQNSGPDLGKMPYIMFGAYLVLLMGIGGYGYIKSKMSEEDYYLAGRRQSFIVTVLTIMAAYFSSAGMLGFPGTAYKEGVAFFLMTLNLPVAGCAIYLLGSRIGRIGRVKGYVTPADMISDYYDNSSILRILVAFIGFLYGVPYLIIQIRAGGHIAEQIFSSTPTVMILGGQYSVFTVGTTILTLVMMLYVLVGGMRSVALADVVQGSLLLCGTLVAGGVTIYAFGGVGKYCEAVSKLPPKALSLPGITDRFSPWTMLTICLFASTASIIQPAQWMRLYAAKSARALKQSAVTFCAILPVCFLLGIMLVGLGARAMYPPTDTVDAVTGAVTSVTPHPVIGNFDQALVALLKNKGVEVLGTAGPFVVMLILMAILAAAMSTADASLHALSAVLTRDIYDRYIRPQAGEKERAWVGRIVIVIAALLALWLVQVGQNNQNFKPLQMITEMMFVAIAFSCQILPVTIDMLFIRKGTRAGAVCGMIAGLAVVFCFTPLPSLLLGRGLGSDIAGGAAYFKKLFDIGFCGFVVNLPVFVLVSLFTKKPNPDRVAEFKKIGKG
ncbi:MAG: sodium:solute symporter family protein [Sedimentisphaerales bacterium]|nr:sodium:solute symporter family protein [Sedimentisphaerales bacterium]